jgi:hypothetical protein
MRNLLRSLALAVILIPTLTGVPSAKAMTTPATLEACVNESGLCSISGGACSTKGECPIHGEVCNCQ